VAEGLAELTLDAGAGEEGKGAGVAFYDVAFNYVAAFDVDAIARRARGEAEDEDRNEGEDEAEDDDVDDAPEEPAKGEGEAAKKAGGWGFGLFGRK